MRSNTKLQMKSWLISSRKGVHPEPRETTAVARWKNNEMHLKILSPEDQAILDAPLRCTRHGCTGSIPEVSLRTARAWIEHTLSKNPLFRLEANCTLCGIKNSYTYGDVWNLIPVHLRPAPLPHCQSWALVLGKIPVEKLSPDIE